MTVIHLVRHGEYENPDYVFPDSGKGFPLSATGRRQITALAPYFAGRAIAALYASPVLRTYQSAELIGGIVGLPVTVRDCLREVRTTLEGTSMKRFDDTRGELSYLPEFVSRGAETMEDLAGRMHACLEGIRGSHPDSEVIVVSHGDPIRFGIMKYRGMPMDFETSRTIETPLAGVWRLEFDDSSFRGAEPVFRPGNYP